MYPWYHRAQIIQFAKRTVCGSILVWLQWNYHLISPKLLYVILFTIMLWIFKLVLIIPIENLFKAFVSTFFWFAWVQFSVAWIWILFTPGFSGVEDKAEMIRMVICGVLITYMNSLDSWGFAQIPGKVVTLYFLFTHNGDNRWQNLFSYFTKLSWILIFPFGFLVFFWVLSLYCSLRKMTKCQRLHDTKIICL